MALFYRGNYPFNSPSILLNAPDLHGVYYCGYLTEAGDLVPQYIGRAIGTNVSIRSRLFDHFSEKYWPLVSHFGYRLSSGIQGAALEAYEIQQYRPAYNSRAGGVL